MNWTIEKTAGCLLIIIVVMNCSLNSATASDTTHHSFDFHEVLSLDLGKSGNAEIIAISESRCMILATNSRRRSVDFYSFSGSENPSITPLMICGDMNGVPTVFEPTSVTIHPRLPIAFAVTIGRDKKDRGRLLGLDLRQESLGSIVVLQKTGIWPDSVAISPNGRWLVIANEAEKDDETTGSIEVIDLSTLDMDTCPLDSALPRYELPELSDILKEYSGRCEPEFIAFDPLSRFAAVSCQENDSIVIVDFQHERPEAVNRIQLPEGARPDGLSVLPFIMGPTGKRGCLIGIAEEGGKGTHGTWTGNTVSFHWIDPENLDSSVALMSRVDVRPWVDPFQPDARLDPEAVFLIYYAGHPFAFIIIERSDTLLCVDIEDPINPRLIAKKQVGSRPESIAALWDENRLYLLTANEGDGGGGSISLLQFEKQGGITESE